MWEIESAKAVCGRGRCVVKARMVCRGMPRAATVSARERRPHATPEGEDGYSCDGDDDEEGVSDQREGLGHLAEVGARPKDGRVYVGVENGGAPGQGQTAPDQEQQGE